ncbi:MAG: helix-hairpin-helix domain-containing protein [Acidimicrobiia bacterium]|nr:helix-hairpin-helix domain-containing protein [Acidimicrobiia bacterium]
MATNEPPTLDDGTRPGRSTSADRLPLEADPTLAERLEHVLVRIDELRDRPVLAIVAAALALAVASGVWWLGRPGSATPVEAGIPMAAPARSSTTVAPGPATGPDAGPDSGPGSSSATEPPDVLVHVAGAVRHPGIVTLAPGDRIGDAVNAAGGPTADADLHQLNLAAPVVDGLQVRVPVEGEVVSPVGVPAATGGRGSSASGDGPVPLIDLNVATAAELEALPGIGPSLASAIIEWRASNGPFASVDDLLSVPGIGPAKLEGLADLVAP